MDSILLVSIILGFVLNIVIMRFFFKRLADKVSFNNGQTVEPTLTSIPTVSSLKQTVASPAFALAPDLPAKNSVFETDANEMEFNEQTFSTLPSDIKVEVEGGDTGAPPEFDIQKPVVTKGGKA